MLLTAASQSGHRLFIGGDQNSSGFADPTASLATSSSVRVASKQQAADLRLGTSDRMRVQGSFAGEGEILR